MFFYRELGGDRLIAVRVLNPGNHNAELWFDPTTAMVETERELTEGEVCTLEGVALNPVPRRVYRYELSDKENIVFANGMGKGPKMLPGVASLSRFNSKNGMKSNTDAEFAALFTLTKGGWDSKKPKLRVNWMKNQTQPGATGPEELPLWTDLVVASDDSSFELTSTKGGWKFEPHTSTGEVRIWVGAAFDSDTGGEHFIHHFDQIKSPPNIREWPELQKALPKCRTENPRANPGTTFCPDSQYP